MDFSLIGKEIKYLRKSLGLSQKELSKDICTQAQISKIESGDIYPLAPTLYLIAQRLGVDINYFFNVSSTPNFPYVLEVSNILLKARIDRNFKEILEVIKHEKKNPIFNKIPKNRQLLLWYEGICLYELNGDRDGALELLKEAIDLTRTNDKVYCEREIEIINSIAVIYYEDEEFNKVIELLLDNLNHLQKIPFLVDSTIKTRIFYNLAKSYTRIKKYKESLNECNRGIDWCIESNTLYLFAEFHYQMGYNYELLKNYGNALKYMEHAHNIFLLQKDTKYLQYIEEKINQIKKNRTDE
jgi:transcriptional regulator with XRE-family HTH domain